MKIWLNLKELVPLFNYLVPFLCPTTKINCRQSCLAFCVNFLFLLSQTCKANQPLTLLCLWENLDLLTFFFHKKHRHQHYLTFRNEQEAQKLLALFRRNKNVGALTEFGPLTVAATIKLFCQELKVRKLTKNSSRNSIIAQKLLLVMSFRVPSYLILTKLSSKLLPNWVTSLVSWLI